MPNPFDQSEGSQPQAQQFEDKTPEEFMSELVGEGKKYATPEEAVRALAHANNHISTIEGENATFKEQLNKAATVDDIMKRMQEATPPPTNTDEQDPAQESKGDTVDVEALVQQKLSEYTSNQSAQANKQQVIDAMKQQFGDKAVTVWDEVESSLGVDLENLAKTTPQAALKLLGVTKESGTQDTGSYSSTATPPKGNEQRPPEGSKRLADHLLAKGEITRKQAYNMKLQFSADPAKYNA